MLEPLDAREKRRFLSLRDEINVFMGLVRQLNQQVVEEMWEETEGTKTKLRRSVEQIAGKAGQMN